MLLPPSHQRNTTAARFTAPAVFSCAVLLGGLPGCQIGGEGDVRVHNTELREENATLKSEIDSMQRRIEGLLTQLETADQGDRHVLRGQPLVLTQIKIGRYSTPMDTDGDGGDDQLKVDLTTHDQDGNAFAAAGAVRIQLVAVDAQDEELGMLAEAVFDTGQVKASYFNGFMGTQYAFKMPLDAAAEQPEGTETVEIRVAFTDAYTDAVLTASRPVSVKW